MKKIFCIALLASLCFGAVAQEQAAQAKVNVGDKVPSFTVTMFDGSSMAIRELEGKVVLLNFWATWCPPCKEELKRVEEDIIERFAGRDFVFLPVSRGEKRETVAAFREASGYEFPMGLDPDASIFNMFGAQGIPHNFVIGRDGIVKEIEIGYSPESFDGMVGKIEKLLENKK